MGKVFAIATEVCSNILYIIEKATYSRGVSCTEFYYGSFLCTEFPILFYILSSLYSAIVLNICA